MLFFRTTGIAHWMPAGCWMAVWQAGAHKTAAVHTACLASCWCVHTCSQESNAHLQLGRYISHNPVSVTLPSSLNSESKSEWVALSDFRHKGHSHRQISGIRVLEQLRPHIPSLARLVQKLHTNIQFRLGLTEHHAVHEPVLIQSDIIHIVDQLQQELWWETVRPEVPYKINQSKRV